ncbi:uncharacterized protein LOC112573788 [Pomacea canaliculata]|uniref:uncharacterized protein LOC112573788 n=1 Tax=Pomacea canaliculata TaxID=400727 RepID=UPI000D72D46B|nr:uncharacterized protein LOC112573788 [Pomacea canaliculata]
MTTYILDAIVGKDKANHGVVAYLREAKLLHVVNQSLTQLHSKDGMVDTGRIRHRAKFWESSEAYQTVEVQTQHQPPTISERPLNDIDEIQIPPHQTPVEPKQKTKQSWKDLNKQMPLQRKLKNRQSTVTRETTLWSAY